jgi:DNA-directed RNA polymerase specialized sigma subunit
VHSTRKSAGGGTKVIYCANASSPEKDLLKSELREKVLKILKTFPPEKVRLILLFWSGKSPKEIAELTQIPLKTVYGILKRIQKEIVKELDLQEKLDQEPELDAVLMDLIVSGLGNQTNAACHL